ncbi:MAG TPA: metallophosphoesterase, partial [Symbiobacteriaceae bacterium]|nr:metallophosphoesterase [Symbiobacteriaceae bacterium]
MRNRLLFFGVVLAVFGGINYYIGLRGWQWLGAAAPGLALGWVYWVLFAFVSSAFLVARFAGSALPRPVADWLARAGSYWLVAFLYLLPLLLVIDLVRAVTGLSGAALVPVGFALVGGLVVLVAYGAWRARNVVVVRHEIAVAKPGGKHKELHVVLVSDTHLGAINGLPRLQAMVGMVNALEPDLVLLAGDICDDDFAPFVALDMASGLAKLRAKLGVYSVLGNHEYIAGHIAEYRREMARAGIRVLVDEAVLVDDSFYVIGRDDISAGGFGG